MDGELWLPIRVISLVVSPGGAWSSMYPEDSTWNAISFSADGEHIAAVGSLGLVVSHDRGRSWSSPNPAQPLNSVAMSADGSTIIAAQQGGGCGAPPRPDKAGSGPSPKPIGFRWRAPAMGRT